MNHLKLSTERSLRNENTNRTPIHNSSVNILGMKISQKKKKTHSLFYDLEILKA